MPGPSSLGRACKGGMHVPSSLGRVCYRKRSQFSGPCVLPCVQGSSSLDRVREGSIHVRSSLLHVCACMYGPSSLGRVCTLTYTLYARLLVRAGQLAEPYVLTFISALHARL